MREQGRQEISFLRGKTEWHGWLPTYRSVDGQMKLKEWRLCWLLSDLKVERCACKVRDRSLTVWRYASNGYAQDLGMENGS